MMEDIEKPGWVTIAMHDPAGRRGVWMRLTGLVLDVCAGREGDDWHAQITLPDEKCAAEVRMIISTAAAMLVEAGEVSARRRAEGWREALRNELVFDRREEEPLTSKGDR